MIVVLLFSAAHRESIASDQTYRYEARMAVLNAGILTLDFSRRGEDYEFLGGFQTSAMNKYYTWNGLFASKGAWQDGKPQNRAI